MFAHQIIKNVTTVQQKQDKSIAAASKLYKDKPFGHHFESNSKLKVYLIVTHNYTA